MVLLDSFWEQPLRRVLSELVPVQLREYRFRLVFSACALTLVCSLLLGGGTRGGFLSDAILELLAIPAILVSLSSLIDLSDWRVKTRVDLYWALAFCFAIALLPLVQLIPLPPRIWTKLGGREEIEAVFDLLGGRRPWMPISVVPDATWLSFLSLLAPLAIFLGTVQLGYRDRRILTLCIVAVGIISAFLGLTQVAQGPASPLRFFSFTNNADAVGFFANRNHFAALLYTVLLFAAAWGIDAAFKYGTWNNLRNSAPVAIGALTASCMVPVVVLAGEGIARSRAGIILTIAALVGTLAMAFAHRRKAVGPGSSMMAALAPSKLFLLAISLAVMLVIQFSLYRIADRFVDPLQGARIIFARNTLHAAMAFMPFGAGLGTFVPVYAMFEKPSDTLANIYANHAHNDILELWLETGVMGITLMVGFVIWLGFSSVRAWRRSPGDMSPLDCSLVQAATIVIGLLIAHSFVDYPLRTEAMMAIFAFSCALLIEPVRAAQTAISAARQPLRESVPREELKRPASSAPVPGFSSPRPAPRPAADQFQKSLQQPGGRWGEDIDWPKEWRSKEPDAATGKTAGPEKRDK